LAVATKAFLQVNVKRNSVSLKISAETVLLVSKEEHLIKFYAELLKSVDGSPKKIW